MALELVYTSVPTGLKRGAYGFCTVACTKNIPAIIASTLENLSGYRHLYPAGSPQNPVVYSHLALKLGGLPGHLLSRIADAGLDYTQRTNKLAHHVVLQDQIDDLPLAGPAALFTRPDMFLTQWNQEPAYFPNEKQIPAFDVPSAVCRRWGSVVGDPGWGGVLAGSLVLKRPVTVVYTPGTDIFPLFCESVALLPHDQRWNATFTTFYTKLPPGTSCLWKGVIAGSTEEAQARAIPKTIVINLSESQIGGQIEDWESSDPEVARLIDIARNGAPKPASPRRSANRNGQPAAVPPRQQQTEMDDFDAMLGELTETAHRTAVYTGRKPVSSRMSMDGTSFDYDDEDGKGANWGLIIGIISAVVILLLVGGGITGYTIYSRYQNSQNQPVTNGDNPDSDQTEDSEFNDPTTPSETPKGATEEPEQPNSPEDIKKDGKTSEDITVTRAKNKLARLEDKPKEDDVKIPETEKSIDECINDREIDSILETEDCLTEIIENLENKSTEQNNQTEQISADQFSYSIKSIKSKIKKINLIEEIKKDENRAQLTMIKKWITSIDDVIEGIDESEKDTSKLDTTVSKIAEIELLDLEDVKNKLEKNKNVLKEGLTALSSGKVQDLLKDVNDIINRNPDNPGMKDVKDRYEEIYEDIGIDDDHKGEIILAVEKRIEAIDKFINSTPEDNQDRCLYDKLVACTNDLQEELKTLLNNRKQTIEEERDNVFMQNQFVQIESVVLDNKELGKKGKQKPTDQPKAGDGGSDSDGGSADEKDDILFSYTIKSPLDIQKIKECLEKYRWNIKLDYKPVLPDTQISYRIEEIEAEGDNSNSVLFHGTLRALSGDPTDKPDGLLEIKVSKDKIEFSKTTGYDLNNEDLEKIRLGNLSIECMSKENQPISKMTLPLINQVDEYTFKIQLCDFIEVINESKKGRRNSRDITRNLKIEIPIKKFIQNSKRNTSIIESELLPQLLSNEIIPLSNNGQSPRVSQLKSIDTKTYQNNNYDVYISWEVTLDRGNIKLTNAKFTTDRSILKDGHKKEPEAETHFESPPKPLQNFCEEQASNSIHNDDEQFDLSSYAEEIKQGILEKMGSNKDDMSFKYNIVPDEHQQLVIKWKNQ